MVMTFAGLWWTLSGALTIFILRLHWQFATLPVKQPVLSNEQRGAIPVANSARPSNNDDVASSWINLPHVVISLIASLCLIYWISRSSVHMVRAQKSLVLGAFDVDLPRLYDVAHNELFGDGPRKAADPGSILDSVRDLLPNDDRSLLRRSIFCGLDSRATGLNP